MTDKTEMIKPYYLKKTKWRFYGIWAYGLLVSSSWKQTIKAMSKIMFASILFVAALSITAYGCGNGEPEIPAQSETTKPSEGNNEETNESMRMNIIIGDKTITAMMEDNAAGRDFLSRLPLEVTLEDFNNTTEKIFYPTPALDMADVKRGCAPVPGDITIYAPWKNVAIFCKNWSYSNDLIKIGHIEGDGIEALRTAGDIKVKFERQ